MYRHIASGAAALLLVAQSSLPVAALKNGLAVTPQLGWNTWYAFGCNISEDIVLSSAEIMVNLGFKDLGYEYVLIDDCWSAGRNSTGHLQVNSTKFPNGMAHVADRVHALGLKLGIYSDAGNFTCGGYAGSLGHEEIDAQTWASWGIDYLKYDNCYNDGNSGTPQISATRYKAMGNALNATGRPMLYSMCNWGEDYPWAWAQTVANSWRMSGDVWDMFDRPDPRCPCAELDGLNCAEAGYYCSVMNVVNKAVYFISKGGPGNWNDLDMLQAGNGGMTDSEYQVQMSLWAAIKSPLIMGNDLRKLTPSTLSLLQTTSVLAVSQDLLGTGANRRWRYFVDPDAYGQGEIALWTGPLHGLADLGGTDMLVLFVNAGNIDRHLNTTLDEIWYDYGPNGIAPQVQQAWDVYDLWASRMSNATASAILNGTFAAGSNSTARWNATANGGYAGVPDSNNPALMGVKVGTIAPRGSWTALVPRHGVKMYRLRRSSTVYHGEL